jgi:uncharacterized membrane protein
LFALITPISLLLSSPTTKAMKHKIVAGTLFFIIAFVLGTYFGAGVDWFLATVIAICIVLLFAVNTYVSGHP